MGDKWVQLGRVSCAWAGTEMRDYTGRKGQGFVCSETQHRHRQALAGERERRCCREQNAFVQQLGKFILEAESCHPRHVSEMPAVKITCVCSPRPRAFPSLGKTQWIQQDPSAGVCRSGSHSDLAEKRFLKQVLVALPLHPNILVDATSRAGARGRRRNSWVSTRLHNK